MRLVNRQAEQLAAAQGEIKRLQAEMLSFEAQQLSSKAEPIRAVGPPGDKALSQPVAQ